MMERAATPKFCLPVICVTTPINIVPKKLAPLPQISNKPKYSPLAFSGMIFAKYDLDKA